MVHISEVLSKVIENLKEKSKKQEAEGNERGYQQN